LRNITAANRVRRARKKSGSESKKVSGALTLVDSRDKSWKLILLLRGSHCGKKVWTME
jgi:hypothetical protein